MAATVLAQRSFAMLAVCVCAACGGSGSHDDSPEDPGGAAGTGGALAAGAGGKGGSQNSAGSSNGGGGAAAGHGGNATNGGAASSGAASGGASSGGSGSTGEVFTGPGTVTDVWNGFCVATFSADYVVKDAFQKTLFTALAGEKYLMVRYSEVGATLAYLTPTGPIRFDAPANAEFVFPFTSNCAPSPPNQYFVVFADVSVYAEPELTTKLCDLHNGDSVPRDISKNVGYGLENVNDSTAVYEVFLNAFSAQCGGMDNGYISTRAITALGSKQILVPFEMIEAEK